MIRKMFVENFKCIESIDWLDLGQLTLIAGANSSGKTSLLQCLLLLKQTLADRDPDVVLKLNGPLVQLGSFRDVVSHGDVGRQIRIGLELDVPHPPQRLRYLLGEDWDAGEHGERRTKGRCILSFSVDENGKDVELRSAEACLATDPFDLAQAMTGHSFNIDLEHKGSLLWNRFVRHMDDSWLVNLNDMRGVHSPTFRNLRGKLERRAHAIYTLTGKSSMLFGLIPVDLEVSRDSIYEVLGQRRSDVTSDRDVEMVIFTVSDIMRAALNEALHSMSYVGPLREEPKRYYFYDEARALSIGKKGEYAAQILSEEGDREVSYIRSTEDRIVVTESLGEAVNHWLHDHMSLGVNVSVKPLTDSIYDVRVGAGEGETEEEASILNVGFGVSQVLPILVEGLRIQERASLVLEQPEIHLHPKMQADLADFLLCLALGNRQVIVETHSDHLVNRIRRRVAEDDGDILSRLLAVYFAEPAGRGPQFTRVDFDELACTKMWPKGFFDQADIDNRALLEVQFRKIDQKGDKR